MLTGKCSWFGGPNDTGVAPDEGLAFIDAYSDAPDLFLAQQPPGTTGLARRLNPAKKYIACRWDYDETPKDVLLTMRVLVYAPRTRRLLIARPADWGPHEDTGRIADISPGLMDALGIETDDEVQVMLPGEFAQRSLRERQEPVPVGGAMIAMSSGHGKLIRGASGVIDEVDEARRVVEEVAMQLRALGTTVVTFHDDVSTTQSENLDRIVDWHNSQTRDLDVSVHFNAYEPTNNPMGVECLYVSQDALAAEVSDAISGAGYLKDRGAKYRDDLAFLNGTEAPSILIETCFVDSTADASLYGNYFTQICAAIAATLVDEAPGVA